MPKNDEIVVPDLSKLNERASNDTAKLANGRTKSDSNATQASLNIDSEAAGKASFWSKCCCGIFGKLTGSTRKVSYSTWDYADSTIEPSKAAISATK